MAKICIAFRLIVLVAIWREISGRGYRCKSCIPGKYGRTSCYYKCPNSCATCTFDRKDNKCLCTQCTDNSKYGDLCRLSCSAGCDGGTCNIDGSCTCISGYSGNKCDLKDLQICPDKCQTCISPTKCQTCIDGYFNGYRHDVCIHSCRQNCKTCTGYNSCTSCDEGFYGKYCHNDCSSGCQSGICIQDSGTCVCMSGFRGDKCDKCLMSGFRGDKCDQCMAGRYSDNCHQICLSQTCKNNICIRDSGSCSACNVLYYGNNMCDKLCLTSCKGSACDFTTGICTHGCISGYSGDKCCIKNERCLTCSSTSACSKCISGYSGNQCHCPTNCETCDANGQCKSCFAGYENINTNCSECFRNKYGPYCQSECSNNCLNNRENSNCGKNGTCVKGCKDGYYGGKCDLRCDQNCKRFTCSPSNGKCSYGCQEGFRFSGSICVLAVFPVMMFSVALGGAVVFVVVIAVVVVLLIKRRNNCSQCCCATTTDLTVPEDTTHVYLTAISSDPYLDDVISIFVDNVDMEDVE